MKALNLKISSCKVCPYLALVKFPNKPHSIKQWRCGLTHTKIADYTEDNVSNPIFGNPLDKVHESCPLVDIVEEEGAG